MNLNLSENLFAQVEQILKEKQIGITEQNDKKPWGGYFVIDELDKATFVEEFFSEIDIASFGEDKISPKILLVAPEKRLSWQYHYRRAELWKLIGGDAYLARSLDDTEQEKQAMIIGEIIELQQGERHRLIGGENWGLVAEIWQHTFVEQPSDEEDIVRVQDDFGR